MLKKILKAVFKHLPMIFIPSVVGRILGWPLRFLTHDTYALYIPSLRVWAGSVNMIR